MGSQVPSGAKASRVPSGKAKASQVPSGKAKASQAPKAGVPKIVSIGANKAVINLNGKEPVPGLGDFVIWPGHVQKWDFKSVCSKCGGDGVSHYKSTRDGPEENLALQKNDAALQQLIK